MRISGPAATAQLLEQIGGARYGARRQRLPARVAWRTTRRCYIRRGDAISSHTAHAGESRVRNSAAAGYFAYFGDRAGLTRSLLHFRLGAWHVISLNSEIGMAEASAQMQWLRSDRSLNRSRCTLAFWHRPLFSSGPNGDNPDHAGLWRALYRRTWTSSSSPTSPVRTVCAQDPDGASTNARASGSLSWARAARRCRRFS